MTNANGNDAYGDVYYEERDGVQKGAQGDLHDGTGAVASGGAAAVAGNASEGAGSPGRSRPAYGAMQSDYPGWNPYVYGGPDAKPQESADGKGRGSAAAQQLRQPGGAGAYGGPGMDGARPGDGQGGGYGDARVPGRQDGRSGLNGASGGDGDNIMWTPYGSVNLDDPAQNPWYGRWDSLSVVAFITAFLMPFVGLVLGLFSMHRTRVFHMKGRGLAIASVVVSVALLVFEFYLVRSGAYGQLLQSISGTAGASTAPAPSGSASGGSGSSSASAGVYSA